MFQKQNLNVTQGYSWPINPGIINTYSIGEMIGFYKKKYSQYNEANVLKSLCWFEEVDLSDWPILLKTPKLRWGTVKKRIKEATGTYLQQL